MVTSAGTTTLALLVVGEATYATVSFPALSEVTLYEPPSLSAFYHIKHK